MHAPLPSPSPWITRFAGLVAGGGSVLDLACGSGRHLRWLAARGHAVTGIDRDAAALQALGQEVDRTRCTLIVADVENGPWPLVPGRAFDAVVVTHYLWRPLWPRIREALAPGGLLLYETFAAGNEAHGKPTNPDFLLRPGELLQVFADLRVVAFEDGFEATPGPRCVQRLAARRQPPATPSGPAHRLTAPPG